MKRIDYLNLINDEYIEAGKFKIIIPFPHRSFKTIDYTKAGEKIQDWEIINLSEEKKKSFLNNDFINLQPFICNNLLINNKENDDIHCVILEKNWEFDIRVCDESNYCISTLSSDKINLWIFEDNIAFFVLNFYIKEKTKVKDVLKTLFLLKNFRKIYYETGSFTLKGQKTLIDFLFENSKNILNITKEDIDEKLNNKNDDLSFIFNMYEKAKIFSVIKINTVKSERSKKDLDFFENARYDFFRELSFYFASGIEIDAQKGAYDGDIYRQLEEGGIFIDQNVSSVVLYDGVNITVNNKVDDRRVDEYEINTYLIYMINLYIAYKSRYYEYKLNDKYMFFDINAIVSYKKLVFAKNFLFSESIGTTYKNNIIHQKVSNVLNSKNLLESVFQKLEKTQEIYTKNLNFIIAFFTIIFSFLFAEPIKKFAERFIENSFISVTVTFLLIVLFFVGLFWLKNKIFKWLLKIF
jgi:hypothetical protein